MNFSCFTRRNERGSNWTTLKYVEHALSVERVYWVKKMAIKEAHEPVVIDLAPETDYHSDTDTARETGVM